MLQHVPYLAREGCDQVYFFHPVVEFTTHSLSLFAQTRIALRVYTLHHDAQD